MINVAAAFVMALVVSVLLPIPFVIVFAGLLFAVAMNSYQSTR